MIRLVAIVLGVMALGLYYRASKRFSNLEAMTSAPRPRVLVEAVLSGVALSACLYGLSADSDLDLTAGWHSLVAGVITSALVYWGTLRQLSLYKRWVGGVGGKKPQQKN